MKNQSAEFRSGARACLNVVSALPGLFVRGPDNQTVEQGYAHRDTAMAAIMAAAGRLPPRAAGALALLAEVVIFQEFSCGTPNYDLWMPEAVMTEEDRVAARMKFAAMVKQDEDEDMAYKEFKGRLLAKNEGGE